MIFLTLAMLVFSIYTLFIATDTVEVSEGVLRTGLSLVGLVAVKYSDDLVLGMMVFLYAILSILLLSITRNEVQSDSV